MDTSATAAKVKCQICALNTHEDGRCPFSYTSCLISGCIGHLKLGISSTSENFSRKYLKCQFPDYVGFQWLDLAILEATSLNQGCSRSSCKGCFQCGDSSQWKNEFPWGSSPCTTIGCLQTRTLKTSKSLPNVGSNYLKCQNCGSFQWLEAVIDSVKKDKAKGTKLFSEVTVDEFCYRLVTQLALKNGKTTVQVPQMCISM